MKKKYYADDEYDSGSFDSYDESDDVKDNIVSKPNILLFITSILAGIGAYILGEMIFDDRNDNMSYPLLFAIIYTILLVIVAVVTMFTNFIRGNIYNEIFFNNFGRFFIVLPIIIIISFGIAALFQFIYGLSGKKDSGETSSVIFVIDNSGSMDETDEHDERYKAIDTITQNMNHDIPFMIYQFSDGTYLIREMSSLNENPYKYEKKDMGGGTAIKGALTKVLDDYNSGVWKDDINPRVVLLTDGYPTDFSMTRHIKDLISDYRDARISVSIVGVGMADNVLMEAIVESTNGVYIPIENVDDVTLAIDKAAHSAGTGKHLLGVRWSQWRNGLYAFLRILFLSILGIIVGLVATGCCFYGRTVKLTFTISVIKSIIAAVLMELLVQNAEVSSTFQWLVTWILFAVVIALRPSVIPYEDDSYADKDIDSDKEWEATHKTR